MFSTDFMFRQQENLVENQKYQAEFRLLCNKILILHLVLDKFKHSLKKRAVINILNSKI